MKKCVIFLLTLLLIGSLSLSALAAEGESAAVTPEPTEESTGPGTAGTLACTVAAVVAVAILLPTFREKRR